MMRPATCLHTVLVALYIGDACGSLFPASTKFLTASEAKSFQISKRHRRQKRGWFTGAKEEAKKQQREIEEDLREVDQMQKELKCRSMCWKDWSDWGRCDGKCNTGVRRRTRTRNVVAECTNLPCPGPNVETKKCHRDCGEGGEPQSNGCYCRTGWRGECCEDHISCGKPPNPANGDIKGEPRWPRYYGEVIIYECKKGYGLVGPEQRKCQLNGKWDGADTTCARVTCPSVPSPPNGELLNVKNPYVFEDTVGYKCHVGHELHGLGSRTCMAAGGKYGEWSTGEPECRPKMCGDPGTPRNGRRTGIIFTYGGWVNFTCNRGYQLIGSSERLCTESGKWSGTQPVCEQVLCSVPEAPRHGEMSGKGSGVDTRITFTCLHGYELEGEKTITCLQNRSWSAEFPKCNAIGCGDPGKPLNGTRHDHGYLLGQKVNFTCYEGYVLDGASDTTCLASKKWSNPVPKCVACPQGYYKVGPGNGGQCKRCPAHSHTVTAASSKITHCVCDHGYGGSPGGNCVRVTCQKLNPPTNGKPLSCGTNLGDTCIYDCQDGYILHKGSSVRTCTIEGTWDGSPPQCMPCPKNAYKASPASCMPCPSNAFTQGEANMRSGCKCTSGYRGPAGGPCSDINECATSNGRGPCEQACKNYGGGFTCECTIPGHKLQPDKLTCYAAKQCTNLTTADAPEHGGLVCHWYQEQNSQHCTVKCNPGYELPSRTNAFETCGPTTGFTWSFRRIDPEKNLDPCIEEFFPDFQFEGDSAYFVRACEQLSDLEKEEVKREFANMLTDKGVCVKRARRVCDFRNVGIICGKTTRRKRDAGPSIEIEGIKIKFDILAQSDKVKQKDCKPVICPMLRIPARYCERYCRKAYLRFKKAAVLYARVQVNKLFEEQRDNLTFRAAARVFEPQNVTVQTSSVRANCNPGMESAGTMCVPCTEGNYQSAQTHMCKPCPVGTYTDTKMATQCKPCPIGQTTTAPGGKTCTVCSDGYFGAGCKQKCTCVNGKCDPITGECTCSTGWEGSSCDRDINECHLGVCPRQGKCTDTKAPGSGFSCAACAAGYHGNGLVCSSNQG